MTTTLLCILDGFGINPDTYGNAIRQAKTPNFTSLWSSSPHATLVTHGERVGLPAGQMGNSEVGHLNIGAGRVVEQWLVRIGRLLAEDALPSIKSYQSFIAKNRESKTVHFFGLCSNGGVHSHYEHLLSILARFRKDLTAQFVLHLITDGRDTPPQSGAKFIDRVRSEVAKIPNCTIGSICGRFYAMDRDKRWERIKKAYNLYKKADGVKRTDPVTALHESYAQGITDEFVEPISMGNFAVKPEDGFVFWNFREDRMREVVSALCLESFEGFQRTTPLPSPDRVLCFTEFDHSFHLPYLFEPQSLEMHLGETVSKAGLKQLRVAETEKYPHVTYFLNGGVETQYPGEDRKLVPSPRDVKTYDEKPEMSAHGVKDIVLEALRSKQYELIIVNFANCDMVGHTGVLPAAIKAVETVDTCLGEIITELQAQNGNAVIIADHGNAELMVNYSDGTPFTAHTTFPVPVIVIGAPQKTALWDEGALCDIAPTILDLMKLPKPSAMAGRSLLGA